MSSILNIVKMYVANPNTETGLIFTKPVTDLDQYRNKDSIAPKPTA